MTNMHNLHTQSCVSVCTVYVCVGGDACKQGLTLLIQRMCADTRVNTVGFLLTLHPREETKLATPWTTHLLPTTQFRGPPESPYSNRTNNRVLLCAFVGQCIIEPQCHCDPAIVLCEIEKTIIIISKK